MWGVVVAVVASWLTVCQAALSPVVDSPFGKVQGTLSADGSIEYLGLPYAKAPTGTLRWSAPVGNTLTDTLTATAYGSSCPQPVNDYASYPALTYSEDCLFLNVFTPPTTGAHQPWPVFIYLHGGAFEMGSSSLYPGGVLAAAGNIIIITVNYRLGALGFWVTPQLIDQSADAEHLNFGLLDQQSALQWVQDNIAAYGGDPDNVVIGGQSAGAAAVSFHLLMSNSSGLFNRAILESAGELTLNTVDEALLTGEMLTQACNCNGAANVLTCMRAVSVTAVMAGQAQTGPYEPIVDGVAITDQPALLFAAGDFNTDIPLLIGHNAAEGALPTLMLTATTLPAALTAAQFSSAYTDLFPTRTVETVQSWYAPLLPTTPTNAQYFTAFSAMNGDARVVCGVHALAESLLAYGVAPYHYVFSHETADWRWAALGATHDAELSYVWGIDLQYNTTLLTSEQTLSTTIQQYWTAFIATGDPNTDTTPTLWSVYDGSLSSIINLNTGAIDYLPESSEVWAHCSSWFEYYGGLFSEASQVDPSLFVNLQGTWMGTAQVNGEQAACAVESTYVFDSESSTLTVDDDVVFTITDIGDSAVHAYTTTEAEGFYEVCMSYNPSSLDSTLMLTTAFESCDCPTVYTVAVGTTDCGAAPIGSTVVYTGNCKDGECLEPVYDNNARAIILSIGCTLLGLYGLWYVFYYRRKEAKEEAAAAAPPTVPYHSVADAKA